MSGTIERRDGPEPAGLRVFDIEHSSAFKMVKVLNLVAAGFERIEAEFGISLTDWRIISLVAKRPNITGAEISDLSGYTQMLVSRSVNRLERAGYLSRKPHAEDRRRLGLTLSNKGVEIFDRLAPVAAEREDMVAKQLSSLELTQLNHTLDRLLATYPRQRG